jgi:hypothetical protein
LDIGGWSKYNTHQLGGEEISGVDKKEKSVRYKVIGASQT